MDQFSTVELETVEEKEEPQPTIITDVELRNKMLFERRKEYMVLKKIELEKMLTHITKVKNRWAKADVTIKIIGTSIVFISSTLAAIFSAGVLVSPIIISVLSSIAAIKTALTEGVMIGFTTKKKKFYRKKCNIIKEYINKLFLFSEKAREDRIITIEELTIFNRLVTSFENEIASLKSVALNSVSPSIITLSTIA